MRKSAHFRVRWCFNLYPSHYRTAFAFSAFLCPHSIRLHLRSAYLLLHRRSTGLPCFLYMTNEWVRIRLSAGSHHVRVTLAWRRLSDCVPFGLEPSIITAHSKLRRLSTVHITLFIPFSLAPLPFDTNGSCNPLTVQTSPFGRASLLVLLPHGFIA